MELTSALHRKLQSKTEAMRILRQQLEIFRTERDQFKLMAETLQLRYSLKRDGEFNFPGGVGNNVASLLHETRERNTRLTTELESLKQTLAELQGDIEILRSKTLSTKANGKQNQDKSKEEFEWKEERTLFICHLEKLKQKNAQLAFDLKTVIDEKEELITERDAYKCKAHRLNHELIVALNVNEIHPKFLDIDSILLENKYLYERLNNIENELEITMQSMNKYKAMLDTKRKKGLIKLGTNTNAESILSHKQVKAMLESGIDLPTKTDTIQDLKSLCLALLDNLNDKNLALSHQKKTNKMLATKISELEQRVQALAGISDVSLGNGYAPSELLLQGYCPSLVDSTTDVAESLKDKCNIADDSGASEAEELNKHTHASLSDDAMSSSLSTETSRSVVSSEYGGVAVSFGLDEFRRNALYVYETPSSTTESDTITQMGQITNESIARQRMEDLKGLPPELAELVQNALHELDMQDFDEFANSGITTDNEDAGIATDVDDGHHNVLNHIKTDKVVVQ